MPLERCGETGEELEGWLISFRKYAVEQGVSEPTVTSTLSFVGYDPEVIDLDRSQKAFTVTFDEFFKRHVTGKRVARGKEVRKALQPTFEKIEQTYGVPSEILVAIWGLETDYGDNIGTRSSIRSLVTLAFDCRRKERFRSELLSALRILDRGDLRPDEMYGAWAGEVGQTQFMPSSYEKFAVDFDGDGRADLLRSSPDALASTANFLKGHGWHAGEDYKAGTQNFTVIGEWNASELWKKTIAGFAKKLGKLPRKK